MIILFIGCLKFKVIQKGLDLQIKNHALTTVQTCEPDWFNQLENLATIEQIVNDFLKMKQGQKVLHICLPTYQNSVCAICVFEHEYHCAFHKSLSVVKTTILKKPTKCN